MAYIITEPAYRSCALSTSPFGAAVYIQTSGGGIFIYAPQSANGWSGSSGSAAYNEPVIASFMQGSYMVTYTFTVTDGPPYILKVKSVQWY